MNAKRILLYALAATMVAAAAHAYDPVIVHREMTRRAFDSARAKRDFLKQLGVDPQSDPALVSVLREKTAQGSADADRTLPYLVLTHFFDPWNDTGLRQRLLFCLYSTDQFSAVHWITEEPDRNRFDIHDAKRLHRDALTLRTPAERRDAMERLFLNLGHVVHLVQDMAQPEHTRNDQHRWAENVPGTPVVDRRASIYEHLTQYEMQDVLNRSRYLDGYPVITLPSYHAYFTTPDHRGLADYSNRNFVTQDTNFNPWDRECAAERYPSPLLDGATTHTETAIEFTREPPAYLSSPRVVTFDELRHDIPDPNGQPADTGQILTNHSLLDFESQVFNLRDARNQPVRFYSLSDKAMKERAELLMKRAVGYSAGLVDHFFRGQVKASWLQGTSDHAFTIKLTNESAEAISAATVKLYVRLQRTGDPDVLLEVAAVPLQPFAPGATIDLPVVLSGPALFPGERILGFERRIVITGTLGSESGAVIGLVQPPERDEVLVYVSRPEPLPMILGKVALQGDGGIQTLMTLSRYGSDFPGVPPTVEAGGLPSPDGRRMAVVASERYPELYIAEGIPPVSSRRIERSTPEGRLLIFEGGLTWDPESRRLAAFMVRIDCDDPFVCGFRTYGVAIIDALTGAIDFRPLPSINDANRHNVSLGNYWTGNGRFIDGLGSGPAPERRTGISRFELQTNQFTFVPLTHHAIVTALATNHDGTKSYYIGHASFASLPELREYDWTTGTERTLIGSVPMQQAPAHSIALSPRGDRLAFVMLVNTPLLGWVYRGWVYDLVTETSTPAQPSMPSLTGNFAFSWWLPD